jgi:ferredoxin
MTVYSFKWLPIVDAELCTGCGLCVEVCGPKSLEVMQQVVVLARRNTCGSEGHCIPACPEDAIRMEWVEMQGDRTRGKWASGGRVWPGRVRGGRSHG